ncbi:MAG: hypothetical protein EBQ76_07005 [Betaproteobacteria bacterium]|nr:hypothetical protein [Betaproteobacteria bacterium]NBY14465.1 hypothetical protein [Betaproteobacteria bacterium]
MIALVNTPMPTPGSDSLIVGSDIFVRASDKVRLERLLAAITQDRSSVVLVSDSEAMLDHYGRLLADRLRQLPDLLVEVYFPNSTEAVLTRFNRILADMRVADAIAPPVPTTPQRLLVVYDGKATGLKEVQLLSRLLRDFPGANTQVVLLLHQNEADTPAKIEALGKRALRWDVPRPNPDEAKALLEQAEPLGMTPEVQSLLDTIGVQGFEAALALRASLRALAKADQDVPEWTDPGQPRGRAEPRSNRPLAAASLAAANSGGLAAAPMSAGPRPTSGDSPTEPPAKKRPPSLLIVGVVALAASALIAGLQRMPPDFMDQAKERLGLVERGPSPAKEFAEAAAKEAQEAEAAKSDAPADVQKPEAAVASPAPVETAKAEPEKPSTPKPKIDKNAPRPNEKPLGPVPERLDSLELRGQPNASSASPASAPSGGLVEMKVPPAGFYVQHASRETRAEIEAFYKANPSLGRARMLKLKRIGAAGDNFVLLSGPFKSLDEAKAFMAQPQLPKDMWVRPASQLKKMLPEGSP